MLARENEAQIAAPVAGQQVLDQEQERVGGKFRRRLGEAHLSIIMLALVTATALAGVRAEPRYGPSKASLLPAPELVRWYPDYKTHGPGLCAQASQNGCADFLEWPAFKAEIERRVLPQAQDIPPGSTVAVDAHGETVSVMAPDGRAIGIIVMQDGPDARRLPRDGFLYISDRKLKHIRYKFQRFSDGSYIEAPIAEALR